MNYVEIVQKLIGPISPVGETNEDEKRFNNLKEMCGLINYLVTEIDHMAYQNKDRQEGSMRKAGVYAYKFIDETLGIKE